MCARGVRVWLRAPSSVPRVRAAQAAGAPRPCYNSLMKSLAFALLGAALVAAPLFGGLSVLPLGDSITEGSGYAEEAPSYRKPLAAALTEAGYEPTFLGARDYKSAGIANKACRFHTGLSGQRIWSAGGLAGYLPGIEGWLEQAGEPDVITMMIGTNDLMSDASPDGARTFGHWCELVRRILRTRPEAWLVVSPVTPRLWEQGSEARQRAYADFNRAVRGLFDLTEGTLTVGGRPVRCVLGVPNAEGRRRFGEGARLRLADMEAAIGTPQPDLFYANGNDRTHPSQAGYDRMAAVWKAAIDALPRTPRQSAAAPERAPLGAAARVPEAKGFTRLCSVNLSPNAALPEGWAFSDLLGADSVCVARPTRVAYYLELARPGRSVRHVWVEMDAFPGLDAKGLPTATLRREVTGLRVRSNMPGVTPCDGGEGLLRFTRHFIDPKPTEGDDLMAFDWDDTLREVGNYGAFQLFRLTPGEGFPAELLFAYNRWASGNGGADEVQMGPLGQHLGYRGGWRGKKGTASHNGIFSADWPTLSTAAYDIRRMEVWAR